MSRGSLCEECAASPPALARLIAVFQFDDAIRSAIHALKYDDVRALAPTLAGVMAADPRVGRIDADALVPVPLHRRRMRERGYNQAELLARRLGTHLGMPVETGLLTRTADTPSQTEVAEERARAENVRNAFTTSSDAAGRHLVLVDDVATTGSTLNASARALLGAGASRVMAVVVAKEI